jgi:predicted short-subunit dehydrogenase-like oxidoreductase (DUF2520 family)
MDPTNLGELAFTPIRDRFRIIAPYAESAADLALTAALSMLPRMPDDRPENCIEVGAVKDEDANMGLDDRRGMALDEPVGRGPFMVRAV